MLHVKPRLPVCLFLASASPLTSVSCFIPGRTLQLLLLHFKAPPTPAALPKSHITQPTWKCSVNFVFMERKTINKPKLLKCQIIEGTTRLPSAKSSSLNVICDSLYLQHWSRSFGFAGMQSGGQGILWQQHFIHKLDFDVDGYIPHSFFFREN